MAKNVLFSYIIQDTTLKRTSFDACTAFLKIGCQERRLYASWCVETFSTTAAFKLEKKDFTTERTAALASISYFAGGKKHIRL